MGIRKGGRCACCGNEVITYERPLHAAMARQLIRVVVLAGRDPFHVRVLLGQDAGGDFAKLRAWGLIEPVDGEGFGGHSNGWWRVTPTGYDFARGLALVHRYTDWRNRQHVGEPHGPLVDVRACLGKRFSFDELWQEAS